MAKLAQVSSSLGHVRHAVWLLGKHLPFLVCLILLVAVSTWGGGELSEPLNMAGVSQKAIE